MSRTVVSTSNDELKQKKPITVVTASKTFSTRELGSEVEVATDAIVMTLPLITADVIGREITFRNTGANGAVLLAIAPNEVDGINGTIPVSIFEGTANTASGVVNKAWRNTKATAKNGDYVTLRATALTKWTIVGGVGIWVSEA
jgi:hypothetical protein